MVKQYHFDTTLLNQFTVGYDRVLKEAASKNVSSSGYPPHTILQLTPDNSEEPRKWAVCFALAGFKKEDISVTKKKQYIYISGDASNKLTDGVDTVIHNGIAQRKFNTRLPVSSHIEVDTVTLSDGILRIDLVENPPEDEKAIKIDIK